MVAHISLADLLMLDGSSALLEEWTEQLRARWAGHRAGASAGGSIGGAWLDGDAAQAVACDAAMAPYVTGDVNPDALEDLVRLCVQLDRLRRHPRPAPVGPAAQVAEALAPTVRRVRSTSPWSPRPPRPRLVWSAPPPSAMLK